MGSVVFCFVEVEFFCFVLFITDLQSLPNIADYAQLKCVLNIIGTSLK